MSAITKSAHGESCTVYAPGVTNHDPETVVFAHLNGGGIGLKTSDLFDAMRAETATPGWTSVM